MNCGWVLVLGVVCVCVCLFTGNSTRLSLHVSDDGIRVLLVAMTGQVFLWECVDVRDLMGLRDGTVRGIWAHIQPHKDTILPSSQDKEAAQHGIFVKSEVSFSFYFVCVRNASSSDVSMSLTSFQSCITSVFHFLFSIALLPYLYLSPQRPYRLWVMPAYQHLCSHRGRS